MCNGLKPYGIKNAPYFDFTKQSYTKQSIPSKSIKNNTTSNVLNKVAYIKPVNP